MLGDLDGDGDLDAATGAIRYGNNAVLINDGSGAYDLTLLDLFGSQAVRLGDVDDDDDLDLVSVGGGGGVAGSAYVQRNDGDGTMGEAEEIRTSNNPIGLRPRRHRRRRPSPTLRSPAATRAPA